MPENTLPTLENNRYLRFLAFAALYVAQGLPWGLFVVGIPAWLAGKGISAADIGSFIAIAGLPWSFKLVAGPLMDRFTFLQMGRRRPWVIGAQLGIVAGMLVLAAAPAPDQHLMLIAWIGFGINTFCALQDVAVDGMAIDVLPEGERARANAFMFGGQVAGISASSAGGTWLLSHQGLGAAATVVAIAIATIMLIPLLFRERAGERLMPWTTGEASEAALSNQASGFASIFMDLLKALILPMSLLLTLCEFLNRASAGLVLAVTPVVTVQQLGWADTDYSNWQASAGLMAAAFGVLVAPIIDRRGASRALVAAMSIKAIVFFGAGALTFWWAKPGFFSSIILANNLASQVVTVAIIALFMNICSKKVAATQFAVYMASSNLALSAGSALVKPLSVFDNSTMYYFAAGMCVAFVMLWPMFNLERHQARLTLLETEAG